MNRAFWVATVLGALAALLVSSSASARPKAPKRAPGHPPTHLQRYTGSPTAREFAEAHGRNFGSYITECPQAKHPRGHDPLDRRDVDRVEELSNRGDDLRGNYDFACVPQNETSIAVNPLNTANMVAGANDYQGDLNQFDATSTRGKDWYGSTNLAPSNPFGYALTQSDPVFVYDRDGIAYNQEIAFAFDDSNGVFVWRSTNGGFTWSRPCVPFAGDPPNQDEEAVCGGVGDPRQPGDGVITWNQDPTPGTFDGDAPFDDKNWMAAGPRPAGVAPHVLRTRSPAPRRRATRTSIGSDRLHATWTRFDTQGCDEENEFEVPCEGRIWYSLLGRPGPLVVAGEADQRLGRVLHRHRSAGRGRLRRQPVLRPDRAPEDGPARRGVRELQHRRRKPVPLRAVARRRQHVRGAVLRDAGLRRQLPARRRRGRTAWPVASRAAGRC